MADPEQLHDDGVRLGRRRSLLILGLVLVVVAGLVVLRLATSGAQTLPRPTEPPAAPSSPATQAWPDDLPPGTLFVGATGSVVMIDTAGGAMTRTGVPAGPATSMTRLDGGVLVWRGGNPVARTLLVDGQGAVPARGALRTAAALLPGPHGQVWSTTGEGAVRSTWRLVDPEGRASRSVVVRGTAISDGAGGLLEVRGRRFRPAFPGAGSAWRTGDVIATGPDGFVVRACAAGECRFTLHRDGDDPGRTLDTAVGEDTSAGALSPSDRLLVVTETVGGTSTLRVSVVATGEVKDIFATPKGSTDDAVWLDDRWLAMVSEDHLVLYDAVDERVVTPTIPLSDVGPLAWRPR